MLITNLPPYGYDELRTIHTQEFNFPDLNNPAYIIKKMVVSDGQLVGGGILKLCSEAILILDESKPIDLRTFAVRGLITELKSTLRSLRIEDCYAFVRDPNVDRFLRGLDFTDCKGGKPLITQI